jgi:hypothetical protein
MQLNLRASFVLCDAFRLSLGWTLSDVLLRKSEHVWQADAIVAVGLRV